MLKRLLLIVLILVGIGFVFYLFKPQEGNALVGKEGAGKNFTGKSSPGKAPWMRELGLTVSRELLISLEKKLAAKPSAEAVSDIEEFLRGGEDRITGMSLSIEKQGRIEGWPTLRVFLLDLLLKLNPREAARISREILAVETSADEWAIALRNVAKGEASEENRHYLRIQAEALISNLEWQDQPSVGFLNAFDVLVYVEATESLPLLSGMLQRKDRRDLAHAAFLTLDRLVQRQPLRMLSLLKGDLALHQSRPEMAAQQFARADLRDTSQQDIVKAWLIDSSRTSTELENFAAIYPNNNRLISNNLLTSDEQIAGSELNKHDREALEVIRRWQNDPALEVRSRYLKIMEERVSRFVNSADRLTR
jgi:hypothetical protein